MPVTLGRKEKSIGTLGTSREISSGEQTSVCPSWTFKGNRVCPRFTVRCRHVDLVTGASSKRSLVSSGIFRVYCVQVAAFVRALGVSLSSISWRGKFASLDADQDTNANVPRGYMLMGL